MTNDIGTAIAGAVRNTADDFAACRVRRFQFGEVACEVRLPTGTDGFGPGWELFESDGQPAFVANVIAEPAVGPIAESGVNALIPPGDEKPTRSFWTNGAGYIVGRRVVAQYDPTEHRIDILVPGPEHVSAAAVAVRFALAVELAEQGGFFLHCAGLVDKGAAYLFFGPSDSGKSTMAELADADAVLSDEAVIVKKNGSDWTAYGTPFSGMLEVGENTAAPLAAFVKLTKADAGEPMDCVRMTGRRATQELLRSVIALDDGPDAKARAAANALEAAADVPVYDFTFFPVPEAWPLVLSHLDREF